MQPTFPKDISINPALIQRAELFDLHKHYKSMVKDELEFFFKYKNFYIGILSVLLAGTLTGLLSLKQLSLNALVLLVGPALTCVISYFGYRNILIYYRRYTEAWITTTNIKRMLGLDKKALLDPGLMPPVFPSEHGDGFISLYKREPIQKLFRQAEEEGASAEQLLLRLMEQGESLKIVRYTFWAFGIGSAILGTAIIIRCL